MMKTRLLPGFILLFSALSIHLEAQDTEFWFVTPHISSYLVGGTTPLNRPAFLAISNGTYQTAHIEITLYNGGTPIVINRTVASGELYKLDFNNADDYTYPNNQVNIKHIENPRGQAGSITQFGAHIRSVNNVKLTAYYMLNHTESRDIFTLKGHQALGTLFYAPLQSDNAAKSNGGPLGNGNWQGYDQIDIVATEDGTQVEVTPKAAIRIGASGSASANTPRTYTLNKGQTLKIMEHAQDSYPSLAGTKITSDKPVAVTVTEDLVAGDTSGDQIVPVSSLGIRYIVPKGYRNTSPPDRFYLIGTEANTTVKIYESGNTPTVTTTLHVGTAYRRDFSASVNVIYLEADKPVYVYQRSGYGEEGAALLPGVYAIGQTRMSYFQVGGSSVTVRKGFLVFRNNTESGFKISYGSVNMATLSVGSSYTVPNVADWKVARFDLPSQADNQVVTIENVLSPFSLGYITGSGGNNSYGYFSAFGTFEFPEITYMCGSSVTLYGGYARGYEWYFNGSATPFSTEQDVEVNQVGTYTLVMNQDPNTVTASTVVQRVNAGLITDTTVCTGTRPDELSVSGASELPGATYQWQSSPDNATWTDISGATSPAYRPPVLTQTAWYRRGMTSDYCERAYTDAAKVRVSPCTLPVNPHLMTRFRQ